MNETHMEEEGGCCGGKDAQPQGHCKGHWKKRAVMGVFILSLSGSLLLLAMFFATMKEYKYIGRDIPSQTTISVSGDAEEFATPDIAEISFAITNNAKTPAEARTKVDEKMAVLEKFLEENGVEKKDIKTTGYNLYPKYEWQRVAYVPCTVYPCPPYPEGKQVLTGYEVSQSVDVKIRKIDNAGTILGGLADKGATNVSGLTFKVDDEDVVKAKAREEAIKEAKAKAEVLAGSLGVKLVRIISFNEGGNYPSYYGYGGMEMKAMSADSSAPSPTIPVGENKYVSNVTIVYEIQ